MRELACFSKQPWWHWLRLNSCAASETDVLRLLELLVPPRGCLDVFNFLSLCSNRLCFANPTELKVDFAALRELAVLADGPGRGLLLFPEICTMELQLLAAGSPDLDVLSHVFHSLLSAVRANPHNTRLLYEQVSHCLPPPPPSLILYSLIASADSCRPLVAGRSQNHSVRLSQHPEPDRPLLDRFVVPLSLFWPPRSLSLEDVIHVWHLVEKKACLLELPGLLTLSLLLLMLSSWGFEMSFVMWIILVSWEKKILTAICFFCP